MEERQKDIVKRVNEAGRISVAQIQALYQVSADCARRDLRFLESKGVLQRTHGGAIAIAAKSLWPPTFYNPKDVEETREDYLAVAKRAVTYIQKQETVYITPSMVGYYMAQHLPEELECVVATNSVTIGECLRVKKGIRTILLGGEMNYRGHCHDFYTIQMVKNLRLQKAFLSHSGLTTEFGASIHDSAGVAFGRAVMESSVEKIGLYPSVKIGRNAIHSVCKLEEYDRLITDENVSADFLAYLGEIGMRCDVVKLEEA